MTSKYDFSKPYWFYISSKVYISRNENESSMLLYHTDSGEYLEIYQKDCIQLVKSVYKPENLGVVKLMLKDKQQDMIFFLDSIIKYKMGGLIELKDETRKPINLLPILSLSLIPQGIYFEVCRLFQV